MPTIIYMSIILVIMQASTCAYASPDIPVVPLSVVKHENPIPPPEDNDQTIDDLISDEDNIKVDNLNLIKMEPGVHHIVRIGINHLNRIVTPFDNPMIKGASINYGPDNAISGPVSTEIEDNAIYIASTSKKPISLFITESGDESFALSLTLVPTNIPPREITLKLKDNINLPTTAQRKKAMQWEQSQPLYNTIESMLKALALKQIPPGYTSHDVENTDHHCKQTGLSISFDNSQLFKGHDLMVYVGIATNTSPHPIEFKETHCADWDVVAVSSFPFSVLSPNDKTEIFVVKRVIHEKNKPSRKRRSLLERESSND